MGDRADYDNAAWDRNDLAWEESQKYFRSFSTLHKMESFVSEKFERTATWVKPFHIGGYNNLYRMKIEGINDCVPLRLPQPNIVLFPDEKILAEAATASFVVQNTQIPVPRVLFRGVSSPDSDIGPYIIIQNVENCNDISDVLHIPNEEDPDENHMLNPDISEDVLESLYTKIAVHLLQLFKPSFSRIGALAQTGEITFEVAGRPITQNMNSMLQIANIPPAALPSKDRTYSTANDWYIALAEMHGPTHFPTQRPSDDCRNKYVARQLFLKLAKQGHLSTFGFAEDDWSAQSQVKRQTSTLSHAPSGTGSFRIWCDDLRPSNILLNKEDNIAAIIDWEFSYIAPTQFALDPPWWLLLNIPEWWKADIDDWTKIYEVRLKTWLRAIETAENEKSEEGIETSSTRLSKHMRESWETGRFWLNYAARKSWAFDTIFWKYLDHRFFGSKEDPTQQELARQEDPPTQEDLTKQKHITEQDLWKTRIHLLSDKERNSMEAFVERKMEEGKERIVIDDWDDEVVRESLHQVVGEMLGED
ncbi:hypothetical protein LHYA1_G000890 [Lachnellula hyalina]|uniref:Aminoglycoside phosphotransferase domain-containing protein n=1 Tax=Lachnellula hyalina TaxID=1316788 RepID=A0A8H8R723_9HELO|nr:uncharacterized protein LHYA1_G000890 [Lachnellula hyalina]TVY29655.1 hypothetical protein LHYA1_G000890 [Lachnellula hyalina]